MRLVLLAAALCTAAACGDSTPTTPTPTTPATTVAPRPLPEPIVAIGMRGSQWIALDGPPAQMTASLVPASNPQASFDGAEYVTWSVSPEGIVTIDKQGRLTPRANGVVEVVATAGGRTGRITVRVLPDYAGTWSGRLRMIGCSGAGDPRTCGRLMFDSSTGLPVYRDFQLTLAQDRDQVTGTLTVPATLSGRSTVAATGFVRALGALVLEATIPQQALEPVRLTNWSSALTGSQMSGGFTFILPFLSFGSTPLTMRTEHEFIGATRTP